VDGVICRHGVKGHQSSSSLSGEVDVDPDLLFSHLVDLSSLWLLKSRPAGGERHG